uniref:Uncharacterized protein n=1 Tax=Oryza rufipogon TaxID=4529 RepID=A0A0E0Q1U9_ORYRU
MAELRHATAAAAATRASSSPAKRDAESSASSSPLVASSSSPRGGGGGDGKDGAPRSSAPLHHQKYHLPSPLRSLLALEDPRSPTASASYRILVAVVACLFVAALVSAPSVWSRINAPYLCRKDGIRLHCPRVNERESLWENPHAAAASWKPCAERRSDEISGKSSI